ncbi:hypothetical protein NM688_g5792 [Phlebia brevispora]|uniref:Uncharacterized protein n=1 Tax=Phlebia brevispora TaxID=194682 RepID=A0ACC1SPL8_9APHY|nr:hypothetical protein NM688_g5792 [Phlebia brevispora]
MFKLWNEISKAAGPTEPKAAEEAMESVVKSGAADREPVDSAVRVTAPTQREAGSSTNATSQPTNDVKRARSSDEDHSQGDRIKRRKLPTRTRVDEMVVLYDSPPARTETALYARLYEMDSDRTLARQFKYARRVLVELGPCAADLLWREMLEDSATAKAAGQDKMNPKIREVIESWTFDMPNASPLSSNYNVCPQFSRLVDVLQSCETQHTSFRGVIIVKRPVVAAMIVVLLRKLDDDILPELRPYAVIGPNAFDATEQQHAALGAFSSGLYNLIVTTKYADYLELPRLSVVIQYNLFEKPPMHIISRAHADTQETLVIHMVERNNDLHKSLLQSYHDQRTKNPGTVDFAGENLADDSASDSDMEQDESECIEDPTTGRRLTPHDFIDLLRHPVRIPTSSFTLRRDSKGRYIYGVDYHLGSQMWTIEGSAKLTLDDAEKSASYRLCRELFDKGLLDYSQYPKAKHRVDVGKTEMDKDRQSANTSTTTRCYSRKLPQFWTNTLHMFKDKLYPLVVSVGRLNDEYHAPILILTRFWLPHLPDFPVFSSGSQATVRMQRAAPISVNESRLEAIHKYTLRMARAMINKPIDCSVASMAYFFAPLQADWDAKTAKYSPEGAPIVDISWDRVETAIQNWVTPLLSNGGLLEDAQAEDAIIQDRAVEFTNRHYVVRIRRDMSPLSKAEEGEREAGHDNFLEYCKSRRKEFAGLKDEHQPLVQVSPVPPCVNNLSPSSKLVPPPSKYPTKYLIPELCYKFCIPASTFRTALLLPSIMHAIDSLLLVKELNSNLLDDKLEEGLLWSAVTSATASMGRDYERLELLGDSFLKYLASTYFYVTIPSGSEGSLHGARQKVISNKALRTCAIEAGLPPYIQSKPPMPKIWQPRIHQGADDQQEARREDNEQDDDEGDTNDVSAVEAMLEDAPADAQAEKQQRVAGRKRRKQREDYVIQWLGDKTIADVVEAILGAAFLSHGRNTALDIAKILCIPLPSVQAWGSFSMLSPRLSNEATKLHAETLKAVQTLVGHDFNHPVLVSEAICAMVSNATLATICVLTGLYQHLQYTSGEFFSAIALYAEKIWALADKEHKLAEEEKRSPRQFWLEVDPPKVLSDIVESLIGAIYVDDGYDISGAEKFFNNTLKPFFDRHIRLQTLSDHPNTTLTDLFHAHSCQQHNVVKIAEGAKTRYNVLVHGLVLASASDMVGGSALRRAATTALDVLSSDPGFITRVCDCRITRQNKKAQKKNPQGTQAEQGDKASREKGDSGDDEMVEGDNTPARKDEC